MDTTPMLMIDDDKRLSQMVQMYLEPLNYKLHLAGNGQDGLTLLSKQTFHLIILDLMLPDFDGLELCRTIRALPNSTSNTPILMLTAKGTALDRVTGLELGADDYLPKPFEPLELVARIKAILRRGPTNTSKRVLKFGSLEVDLDSRQVRVRSKICSVTAYQFDILITLAERAGRVLTRDQMMDALKGRDLEAFDRTLDVHIGRIRAAIEDDPKNPKRILTIRGAGYMFVRRQD